MRKLIYFLDANRRSDYHEEWINPYYEVISKYCIWNKASKTEFTNYFTQYPSTYRWLLSAFNANPNIDNWGYDFMKVPTTSRNPFKNHLLKILLNHRGYKFRITEVNLEGSTFNTQYTVSGSGMLQGWGEPITHEQILNDNTDNVVDLVYDICFHDLLMESDGKYEDTRIDKEQIYKDALEYSKVLFNQELFRKYDEVWVVSDHGYADWDTNHYWQHNELGEGNPIHHTSPILFYINNHWDSNSSNLQFSEDTRLLDQTQLLDLWLNSRLIPKDFLVVMGYDAIERRYPLKYYIVYPDNKAKFIDLGLFEYYDREPTEVSYEISKEGWDNRVTNPLTRETFDTLYCINPFVSKIFNYTDFKDNPRNEKANLLSGCI